VTNYPCAKFGDFGLSHFDFIVRTDRDTDKITDPDDRYTDATTVGVSNYYYYHEIVHRVHKTIKNKRKSYYVGPIRHYSVTNYKHF